MQRFPSLPLISSRWWEINVKHSVKIRSRTDSSIKDEAANEGAVAKVKEAKTVFLFGSIHLLGRVKSLIQLILTHTDTKTSSSTWITYELFQPVSWWWWWYSLLMSCFPWIYFTTTRPLTSNNLLSTVCWLLEKKLFMIYDLCFINYRPYKVVNHSVIVPSYYFIETI